MASGLAIVSANEGAAPELVEEGRAGICIDRDEPGQIADALHHLLTEAELETLGKNARRRVEGLTWSATFERELAVYRELLRLRRCGDQPGMGLHAADELLRRDVAYGPEQRARLSSIG